MHDDALYRLLHQYLLKSHYILDLIWIIMYIVYIAGPKLLTWLLEQINKFNSKNYLLLIYSAVIWKY